MSKIMGEWAVNQDVTVEHATHNCLHGGLCSYPFCENKLNCNREGEIAAADEEDVNKLTSVKQYFTYQEELNTLQSKINKLESAQKDIYDGIRVDITTVFLSHGYNTTDFEIELTSSGICITLYVKKFNDSQLVSGINTELFTHLNELMNMPGKINIVNDQVVAGNHVYAIELYYEL